MYILSNIKENIDRAWQRMLSGRRLDLLNPSPLDIEAEDIAHGLSFLARWNGQTFGEFPLSVAYHSLLVQELFSREIKNADKSAAWIEATQMAGFTEKEADKIFGSQKEDFVKKYKFIPMSPFKTREAFISRLNKLLEKIN